MSAKQVPLTYFTSKRDIILFHREAIQRVLVEAGVPTHVPKALHSVALEKGLEPCDANGKPLGNAADLVEDPPKVLLAPEDADEREAAIKEAMKAIVARNDASDFTSGGTPSSTAVTAAVGWKVDQKENRKVWEKHRRELLGAPAELTA